MTQGTDLSVELAGAGSTAEVAEALRASGVVDSLLAQIDGGEVALTGEGGLLPGLIKLALERGLAAELTGHLGYEKGDPVGRVLPNARNGSSAKTVQTEAGPVGLNVPRDRDGSFTPRLVPKGQRDLTPCVGHAQSQDVLGGSEMIQRDGKEKLSRRVQA